jgi:hypothetical protein
MKHILPILFLAILTGCAKDTPAPPSQPAPPAFDPASPAVQIGPEGTIPREPVTFVWHSYPHAIGYTIEYQRDVPTHPGHYQYWSAKQTNDTTITIPLPLSPIINHGRWRVITRGPNGVSGMSSGWMFFTFAP